MPVYMCIVAYIMQVYSNDNKHMNKVKRECPNCRQEDLLASHAGGMGEKSHEGIAQAVRWCSPGYAIA